MFGNVFFNINNGQQKPFHMLWHMLQFGNAVVKASLNHLFPRYEYHSKKKRWLGERSTSNGQEINNFDSIVKNALNEDFVITQIFKESIYCIVKLLAKAIELTL